MEKRSYCCSPIHAWLVPLAGYQPWVLPLLKFEPHAGYLEARVLVGLLYQTERIRVICQVVSLSNIVGTSRGTRDYGRLLEWWVSGIPQRTFLQLLAQQAVVARDETGSCRYSVSSCSVLSTSKEA